MEVKVIIQVVLEEVELSVIDKEHMSAQKTTKYVTVSVVIVDLCSLRSGYVWNKIIIFVSISLFCVTCNHVWNWNKRSSKIISATVNMLKNIPELQ